jgi:carbon monoxide dehydrogenase subunit G
MPSATFSHSVHVDRPRAEIWDDLQDPEIWASVGPVQKVWDPRFEDGVLVGFKWSTNIGGRTYEGVGTALEHDRPDRYTLDLDAGEMAGKVGTSLEDSNPGGTDIDVSIELRSQGMLSSLFFPAIKSAIGSGFPDQVNDMATKLSEA